MLKSKNYRINPMFTSTNYNNFNRFNYNLALNKQRESTEVQTNPISKTSKSKVPLIALSLVALAAAGGAIYLNSVKGKSLDIQEILQQNPEIAKIYNGFDLKKYTIFKNHTPIDKLRLTIASIKADKHIEGLELPQMVTFKNIKDYDLPKFSTLFADFLQIKNTQYVYNGNLKAFMDVLEEFNTKQTGNPNFINIVNKENFIEDFNKLEDSVLKERFLAFFKGMKKNQSVLITNDNEFNKLFKQLDLKHTNNSFYCTRVLVSDYQNFLENQKMQMLANYPNISSKYKDLGAVSEDCHAAAKLISPGNSRNALISIEDKELREKFIKQLSEDCSVYRLSGISNEKIYEAVTELESKYQVRPDVPRFIYLEDFDKMSLKEIEQNFSTLFEERNTRCHTRFIIPTKNTTQNGNTIMPFNIKLAKFKKPDSTGLEETEAIKLEDYLMFLREKIKGFSFKSYGNANIIVQADSIEKADALTANIEKAIGFRKYKVSYDDTSEKIIKRVFGQLNEAEKRFQEAGEYSIIELGDFDKYLSKKYYASDAEAAELINAIKEANDKYHSIIFLKLSHPIEELCNNITQDTVFGTVIKS